MSATFPASKNLQYKLSTKTLIKPFSYFFSLADHQLCTNSLSAICPLCYILLTTTHLQSKESYITFALCSQTPTLSQMSNSRRIALTKILPFCNMIPKKMKIVNHMDLDDALFPGSDLVLIQYIPFHTSIHVEPTYYHF